MAKSDDASSEKHNTPKKKGLGIPLLVGPATAVPTSVGTLYLYDLRTSDFHVLEALPAVGAIARIRAFLPRIASLVEVKGFKDERPPLAIEEVNKLTDAEVEKIAETYMKLLRPRPRIDDEEAERPKRIADESGIAYLDRLLKHESQEQSRQLKKMRKKMFASTNSIFDEVRRSSSALGLTLGEFERLTEKPSAIDTLPYSIDHFQTINETFAREAAEKARERAEELEMVRLTGKMTAESAKNLKDLAEAATVLLEQLDERDKKADRSTRKQITIAVWSVGITAVLALLALIVSGLTYFQGKINNENDSRWQTELIAVIKDSNEKLGSVEEESREMQSRLVELEEKISDLEPGQVLELPATNTNLETHQ